MSIITKKIAEELNIRESQVESTIKLIDDGNTIPFIARYRKEVTGNLSDEILRTLDERLKYLRNLEARKEEIIRLIDEQGKLTDELTLKIASTTVLSELEDIYRPFRPKKRTKATIAKEKGLDSSLLAYFDYKTIKAEELNAKIDEISTTFNKAVEKAVNERLKEDTPTTKTGFEKTEVTEKSRTSF